MVVEGDGDSPLEQRKTEDKATTSSGDDDRRRDGKVKLNFGASSSSGAPSQDASCSTQAQAVGYEPSVSERTGSGNAAAPPGFMDSFPRGFTTMPFAENWPLPPILGPGFDFGSVGPPPLVPVLLPGPVPTFYRAQGNDQHPHQGGVFAVPVMPMFGPFGGVPQGVSSLFLSVCLPPPVTSDQDPQGSASVVPAEAGRAGQGDGREAGADGLRQRHVARGVAPGGRVDNQRLVRRFRVGFQVDLLLILKLAVVVFVFNQDGSKDRLMLLLLLAGIVYLYQTGALAPILRWISQSAQRAMMPPQQPLPEGGLNREPGGPELENRGVVGGEAGEGAAPAGAPGPEVGEGRGGLGLDGVPRPPNPNCTKETDDERERQ